MIASVCIDIVYKPKQMRIIVLFLVLFADLEGHLPNNLNWTNTWSVSRNHVITIDWLWTFSVFTCTLSFVRLLWFSLSFENRFVCTLCMFWIFSYGTLLHLFHLLEEVGVVVLFRSLRTETRIIITMEEAKITCRGRRAWGRPCPPSPCSSWRSSWPTSGSLSSLPRSPGTSQMLIFLCSVDDEI